MKKNSITVFGEVLVDQFPDGSQVLGGAPFNVAWHLQALGHNPRFISRIGDDQAGKSIRAAMQQWDMNLDALQQDAVYPTGLVQVTIERGEPTYTILANQAYDHIGLPDLDELQQSGILYHGTLAMRSVISRKSLQAIKKSYRGKIFVDVNLRQPWWNKAEVLQLIADADWLKLNSDEMHALQLCSTDFAGLEESMRIVLHKYNLEGIIVTRAEKGALALNCDGEFVVVPANQVGNIVDTVGAGDAFSAMALHGLALGWPLNQLMAKAESFASAIISQRGATVNELGFYEPFLS